VAAEGEAPVRCYVADDNGVIVRNSPNYLAYFGDGEVHTHFPLGIDAADAVGSVIATLTYIALREGHRLTELRELMVEITDRAVTAGARRWAKEGARRA
jgi:hypothetical protein